jgi:hypothetical protein
MDDSTKSQNGCFGKGCLVIFLGSIAVAMMVGAGAFYLYGKMLDRFTSTHSVDVQVVALDRNAIQVARLTLDRFRAALANNREETIEFTAADLNALVSADPDFAKARDRVRFVMTDSTMTMDLSVPVDSIPLPRFHDRWFNGTLRFNLDYSYGQFAFRPQLIQTSGGRVPDWLLTSELGSSFSHGFTKSFNEAVQKNRQGATFWKHIKKIAVAADKLVVSTQRVVD